MTAKPDKMLIWSEVSKTDPAHTKKVNQRGGFTAISAHYQIMRATEVFGPVGEGWGYINGTPVFESGLVIVPVTIWHGSRDNTFGPLYGAAEMAPKTKEGPRLDSDAPKKASTDGLTKGLSQLGFNADVFLGRFDDNKYIEQMRAEFASDTKPEFISDEQRTELMLLATGKNIDAKTLCELGKIASVKEMPADMFEEAKAWLGRQKKRELGATGNSPQHDDDLGDSIPY